MCSINQKNQRKTTGNYSIQNIDYKCDSNDYLLYCDGSDSFIDIQNSSVHEK